MQINLHPGSVSSALVSRLESALLTSIPLSPMLEYEEVT